jgi:hypothetical protein
LKKRLLNFNLKLQINQPTRLISKSCLDNFATNISRGKSEVLDLNLSDHTAQLFTFSVCKCYTLSSWRVRRRDTNNDNVNKFCDAIGRLSFSDVYQQTNTNEAYNSFYEIVRTFYDLCFPHIFVNIKARKKPKSKPKNQSHGIKLSSKNKRMLLWKYKKSPTPANKEFVDTYSNRLKKIINLTQKSQNNFTIKTARNKSKATWSVINQNKNNFPRETIKEISCNDQIITNPTDIANELNNFFVDEIDSTSKVTGK